MKRPLPGIFSSEVNKRLCHWWGNNITTVLKMAMDSLILESSAMEWADGDK